MRGVERVEGEGRGVYFEWMVARQGVPYAAGNGSGDEECPLSGAGFLDGMDEGVGSRGVPEQEWTYRWEGRRRFLGVDGRKRVCPL